MKTLRTVKKHAAPIPAGDPISPLQRKALGKALDLITSALTVDSLLEGKSLVALDAGEGEVVYGIAALDFRKSKSCSISLLVSPDDDTEPAGDYPLFGFRESGKTWEVASSALAEVEPDDLGGLSLSLDDEED